MEKKKVGILGATGTVGQRFIQLLWNHPQFEIARLGASASSANQPYRQACGNRWQLDWQIPESIADMLVNCCDPELFQGCDVIFSGLDSAVAGEIEERFRLAELIVFSNAKNHRFSDKVPLIVPLVNGDHFDVIPLQRQALGLKRGCLITNANCSTTGLVVALKPLHDKFGICDCMVTTMQAISGAGYPGVPSLDILGNIVPNIDGEEEKLRTEPNKILGRLSADTTGTGSTGFEMADINIDASCNRVPVIDGHTMSVALRFRQRPSDAAKLLLEAEHTLRNYRPEAVIVGLYSAPQQPIQVFGSNQPYRPQPRLDLNTANGFAVSVGRLRTGQVFDLQFTLLVHNTILGAAGSSILNAELAINKDLL